MGARQAQVEHVVPGRHGWPRLVVAFLSMLALLMAGPWTQAAADADVQQWSGQLDNGTAYAIQVPDDWSGVLVMEADLQSASSTRVQWLTEQGHAVASRSRAITDWDVGAGSDDLVELREIVIGHVGIPDTTIVTGGSLGGLVSRDAVNTYGDIFDGAVPTCGGGAGLVGMWNHRLDATFALDVLIADGDLELVDITDQRAADAALRQVVNEAMTTPEGRARVALAGAIGQVSGWAARAEEPADDDVEQRLQTIASSLSILLLRRSDLEATAGGNISWNVGVNYRKQFAQSDQASLARELYREAGLNLQADLQSLERAPRIEADPAAVDWARSNGVYDGVLEMPVLDIFTSADARAALSEMNAYAEIVRRAGSAPMLRQSVVDRSGHCAITPAEYVTAVDTVLQRIETGRWAGTATPGALNDRAAELQAATELDLGEAAFTNPGRVPVFPRTFASTDPLP